MSGEFDLALLRELAAACSREDFVERFARDSLRDALRAVPVLEAAGAAGRWTEFRDSAHSIKGITANVGAIRAARIADAAMRRSAHYLAASWRDDCGALREALQAAHAQLDAALALLRRD